MEYIIEEVTNTVSCLIDDCGRREKAHYKRPFIIAVDGRCCAGKTTLAAALKEQNGWSVFHMDDFFLQPKQRTKERLAQPGGNVDYERFLEEVLTPLRGGKTKWTGNAGKTIRDGITERDGIGEKSGYSSASAKIRITYRPFDCRRQDFAEKITVEAEEVVIVEGSYSCHPALRDAYDLRVFLDVSQAEQERRLLERNGVDGSVVFREKWIPLEERYFEACSVRECCDICFGIRNRAGCP